MSLDLPVNDGDDEAPAVEVEATRNGVVRGRTEDLFIEDS